MQKFQLVARSGGTWDGNNYHGGEKRPFTLHMDSSYEDFVSKIYQVLHIDKVKFDIRIFFVATFSTTELFEITDENSFDFMKIDDCRIKWLNIEKVDRISIPPENDRVQAGEGGLRENIHINDNFEVPNQVDEEEVEEVPNQNNESIDFRWIAQEHRIPDHSGLFADYDWSTIDIPQTDNESVPTSGVIGLHALFLKKGDLLGALGLYALENKFEYTVQRSDKRRFEAVCLVSDCSFIIRAKSTSAEGMWVIYKFNAIHSCESNIQQAQGRRVRANTIGQLYASKVVGAKHAPSNVMQDMQNNYGVEIGYSKAWRGLERAKELVYGTAEDSYMYLSSYFSMLMRTNPGTIARIQTVDGHFLYSFCALGASIESFKLYMRPVIIVDATHLTGVYFGKIYAAVCADGNGKIFPLAFGFGPEECNESWEWFMNHLREAFGQPNDLVIISDRHQSINNAVRVIYPGVPHASCYVHMKKNIISNWRNTSAILHVLKNAMYAYKVEDCERYLGEIQRMNPSIYRWLVDDVKRDRWARAYCPKSRYNHMTSNYVESFNYAIKEARKMPITAAHEFYRALCQRWFDQRRQRAELMPNNLTSYASKLLEETCNKINDRGCQLSTIRAHDTYCVYHPEEGWGTVNMGSRYCDCRKWDLDGIPCVHACVAASHSRVSFRTLCSPYYEKETLQKAYAPSINPVPHISTWCAPSVGMEILPPLNMRNAGRPRIGRYRSHSERHRRKKCTKCQRAGHNRKTCTASTSSSSAIPSSSGIPSNASSVPTQESRVSGSKRPPKCSRCGEVGHTRRSKRCPGPNIIEQTNNASVGIITASESSEFSDDEIIDDVSVDSENTQISTGSSDDET